MNTTHYVMAFSLGGQSWTIIVLLPVMTAEAIRDLMVDLNASVVGADWLMADSASLAGEWPSYWGLCCPGLRTVFVRIDAPPDVLSHELGHAVAHVLGPTGQSEAAAGIISEGLQAYAMLTPIMSALLKGYKDAISAPPTEERSG